MISEGDTAIERALGRLGVRPAELEAVCRRFGVSELRFFGSILRDDWRSDSSDVDVLITFASFAENTDFFSAWEELELLAGRKIDLVEREAIEQSTNPYSRPAILDCSRLCFHES